MQSNGEEKLSQPKEDDIKDDCDDDEDGFIQALRGRLNSLGRPQGLPGNRTFSDFSLKGTPSGERLCIVKDFSARSSRTVNTATTGPTSGRVPSLQRSPGPVRELG